MKRQRCVAAVLAIVASLAACDRPGSRPRPPAQATRVRDPAAPSPPAGAFTATVERVVDGDTLIARRAPGNERLRVRVIGIDSPETVQADTATACYGPQASAYLAALLRGSQIMAAYEVGRHQDKFGRELWDIWLPDGTFVAADEVALGYARALRIRPQVEHAAYLSAVEAAAKTARRGLWGACPQ